MGCKTTTTNKFNSTCFIRKRCKVVKLLNTYVGAVSMKSYRKRQRERERKERENSWEEEMSCLIHMPIQFAYLNSIQQIFTNLNALCIVDNMTNCKETGTFKTSQ
jgi:hypothetical protein